MTARLRGCGAVLAGLLICTGVAAAQTESTGAIAGVARDTTGGVLPGVTVEAASPALIEKVRIAVTDDQGNYKIIDLRPGTYSVTFTLPGFTTYRHEGIQLSAGFTATANAEMKVGGLEETVTVTGASPVVDTQNVRTQNVMRAEVLEALPSGMKDLTQFASLTLGAVVSSAGRNDVGGDKAEQSTGLNIHGSRGDDGRTNFDGMSTNSFYGGAGGAQRLYRFNTLAVQETVIDTGGASAETETGGANINMVPRDGGNVFSGLGVANFSNSDLASGKVPDALIARGSTPDQKTMKKVYEFGFGVGGPVMKDRLWFYLANRWWGNEGFYANNYFNKSTDWRRYEPDLSRPAYSDQDFEDYTVRLTWQAAPKHKITGLVGYQYSCQCWALAAASAPEGTPSFIQGPFWLYQGTWSYPATNKLLFQAGGSFLFNQVSWVSRGAPLANQIAIFEQIGVPGGARAGYRYNALDGSILGPAHHDNGTPQKNPVFNERFSAAYVTGSHAVKMGVQLVQGELNTRGNILPNGVSYTFRGGVPVALTQFATPFESEVTARGVSVFAQDQWRINRFTFNYGIRYDHFMAYAPDITVPAGAFVPERRYAAVRDLPLFDDITPRLGVAYDVFGDGKTAIKGVWGRYLMGQGGGTTSTVAPANAIIASTTRTWNDANGNFSPDCILTSLAANGECGPADQLAFGQPRLGSLIWDEASRKGWNVREYNYQWNLSVQHEILTGLGVSVGFFRTDWRNQTATLNTAVSPSDFTEYCITAPTDPRLGASSGKRICGLYDIKPTAFGRNQPVLMLAKDVPGANGRPKEVFNGVDFAVNARFGQGGLAAGGVTLGRTLFDYCWNNGLPNVLQAIGFTGQLATLPRTDGFCNVESPLWNGVGSQAKLLVVYPLPYDFVLSATYKNIPGTPITASYTLTNAQVAPALGRNLAACGALAVCNATATVQLLPSANYQGNRSATMFDERLNQIDLRFTRSFRFVWGRVQAIGELYNVTNMRVPEAINPVFGTAAWLRPTAILGGRLFKFGTQVEF